MKTVAYAVQQTLARLLEAGNSAVAELPSGTGPGATPIITTNDQITNYLDEGQKILARTPLMPLRGSATAASVVAGTKRVDMPSLTTTPSGRTLWRVSSATWTPSGGSAGSLDVSEARLYELYYPREPSGSPAHLFDGGSHVLLGPIPLVDGSLTCQGFLLPADLTYGGNLTDVPDALVPMLVSFACWRVCEQNASQPGLAQQLPLWQAEIAPWAGRFVGL